MSEGLSVLSSLLLLSAMLSIILSIAWATLGRARHALTWAAAFGLGTLQWTANIAFMLLGGSTILFMTVNMLSIVVSALLAIGFRQRAGARTYLPWLLLGGVGTILLVFCTTYVVPEVAIAKAAPQIFRGVVLMLAAGAVMTPGRRTNAAERSAVGMLWAFALFSVIVAVVAIGWGGPASHLAGLDRWILLLGLPTAFAGTGLFAVFLIAADLAERMRLLASRDPLTGILNRRGFEEEARRVIANAVRHRQPLSLALADLDRFKAVNDMHGHAAGDALLCRFAGMIGEAVRTGDLFGRIGGEEFVLLLVNTPGEAAVAVVDRLRREVATQTLDTDPPMTVTTSFGVAELVPGEASLDTLIARADRALYRSKLNGRDRVSFAGREPVAEATPA
ncbi:sensor domain-containing diguanylate cyclase [Sphingomonas solaris]|uniref:diguanylate cyclase n=1 Tax=Alterirhizorhabdus solaris TaxID=2529389 RepID=A0A558R1H0_9SPHN|nr:GGDEF domain-containing protein [Sphingomonas solaris]TVV73223.1 GGDEF domain-containing protein [Sphingomonas solaris]